MTTTEALEMNRLEILHRMELKKKERRTEQERERQNTVAAKQRAEAKVERLEDLLTQIEERVAQFAGVKSGEYDRRNSFADILDVLMKGWQE